MPISTLGSYLPTLQEFITHWTQTNLSTSDSEITLRGGYDLAQFTADKNELADAFQTASTAAVEVGLMASDRDRKKATLRPRLTQFRAVVLGQYGDKLEARELPTVPAFTLAESKFLLPFDQMAVLWQRLNAQDVITLVGGYTLAQFQTELGALRAAYSAVTNGVTEARIAREQRDALLAPIKQRLKQYRQLLPGIFAAEHPLLVTLPALTPPSGATPDAVVLAGVWDSEPGAAVFTWGASNSSRLEHYSVRACFGATYRAIEEAVLSTVPAGTQTFSTDYGLPVAGSVISVKVYVVTRDGNERGSNAVKITRDA